MCYNLEFLFQATLCDSFIQKVESETSDSELKLSNATRRLLKLESDVALLKEKALNTSTSASSTEKEAESINELAEKLKKVLELPGLVMKSMVYMVRFAFVTSCVVVDFYAGSGFRAERQVQ